MTQGLMNSNWETYIALRLKNTNLQAQGQLRNLSGGLVMCYGASDDYCVGLYNNSYLVLGDDDGTILPLSKTNYKLGHQISTLTNTGNSTTQNAATDSDYIMRKISTFKNNTDSDIIVKEVGLYYDDTTFNQQALFGRAILESPVTIGAGEIKTFTFEVR